MIGKSPHLNNKKQLKNSFLTRYFLEFIKKNALKGLDARNKNNYCKEMAR